MEDHLPDRNFASATPTSASTREEGDLWSSSTSTTENVANLPEAGVLEQNCWLQTASPTPFEINGTDQGDGFQAIFNALQNCQLSWDTARVEEEALPEHNVPLSWDILSNPNLAEAIGSGSKRKSNIEMADPRRRKSSPEHSAEQEADHGMREKLEDQRKDRFKRTRSAEVHNMSEKRRRERLRDKMKTLQQLIPNCNKADKVSVLDDAVEYLKGLKLQVEMLAMGGAEGVSTLNLAISAAAGIDNINQGLFSQVPRPIMVMGPSYGYNNNNMTRLPVMPFGHSPLFLASPTLLTQAASFPYYDARAQLLLPAAPRAVNTGFFPRFNYPTTDKGQSSHWNSNQTLSTIDRQAPNASNLGVSPRTPDYNAFFAKRQQ